MMSNFSIDDMFIMNAYSDCAYKNVMMRFSLSGRDSQSSTCGPIVVSVVVDSQVSAGRRVDMTVDARPVPLLRSPKSFFPSNPCGRIVLLLCITFECLALARALWTPSRLAHSVPPGIDYHLKSCARA